MDEIVKVCKKHGHLNISHCLIRKNKYFVCKSCEKERGKIYREKNREKIKKYEKKYAISYKQKNSHNQRKYREKNREIINSKSRDRYYRNIQYSRKIKCKSANKAYAKNPEKYKNIQKWHRENLSDSYIKSQIMHSTKIKKIYIPENFIEVKRIHIKLKRKIRELINGNK